MYCIVCGYALEQLPELRCPECGRAFDPDDRATWAPKPGWVQRSALIAASFLGLFLGGMISYAVLAVVEGYACGWRRDAENVRLAYAFACMWWWVLAVVPLLYVPRVLRFLLVSGAAPFVFAGWAVCGACVFESLVVGTRLADGAAVRALLAAAFIGGSVGVGVHWALRNPRARSAAGLVGQSIWWLRLAGPLLLIVWLVAGWPLTVLLAPDFAYRVGDMETRTTVVGRVFDTVAPGTPVADVARQLPAHFERLGILWTDGRHYLDVHPRYIIDVREGVIVQIMGG